MEIDSVKKIGFIVRGLTKGGTTCFIFNILEQFEKFTDKYEFYIFYNNKSLADRFNFANKIFVKGKNKLIWDYIRLPLVVQKYNLDYVIYSKNIIPFTHLLSKTKKINIIYDLAYFDKLLNTYKFWDTLYMKLFMRTSCRIAGKTIAISQSTKRDIINILGISEDRIKVIYGAVNDNFGKITNEIKLKQIREKYNIKLPFLFYCGSLSPRKNILRVLKAFNQVKNKIPHNIYLAGGKSWKDKGVINYINSNLSDRVFRIGHIEEDELVVLYSMADLYLYPSLYEGFGLPILEAQACGCPVLTSNTTSCLEVAGDRAYFVDPYSSKQIRDGILRIINDKGCREELIKKGYENVKRFSWKRTAKEILEIMK